MSSNNSRRGQNLMLASVMALLSYVPFEWVAKGSLLAAVLLFVFDPIPPVSRIFALLSVVIVGLLSKVHRQWQESQAREDTAMKIKVVTRPDAKKRPKPKKED